MKKSPPRSWSSQSPSSRYQQITRMEWPTATAAFLLADASGQPPELSGQVSVAALAAAQAHSASTSASQRLPLVGVPERRLPPVMLLPGQRPAQLARCPAVGNTVMSTPHVGDDDLGGAFADPGDGDPAGHGPPRTGRSPRRCGHPGRRWRLPGAPWWSRASPTSNAWWSPKRPRSAWRSWGSFLRSLPLASSARALGSRSPATRAASIARPETPRTSVATETLLDAGVLQGLLDPLALGAVGLDQAFAVAGQIPQLADRRRRHEAAAQQPTLQQLSKPGRVADVGLAAGQDPGRGGRWPAAIPTRAPPAPTRSASSSWPVASITTWVTPSACSQSARVSR